jgi:hypothetical protein
LHSKLGNADDVNEFGENMFYTKKDIHTLLATGKEVGLEVL